MQTGQPSLLRFASVVRARPREDAYRRTTGFIADLRVSGCWRAEGQSADGQPLFKEEFLEVAPYTPDLQRFCR